MKEEYKKVWLAALRSGNYPQTRKYLHDSVGYCCLGVLCEVTKVEGWDGTNLDQAPDVEELNEEVRGIFGLKNSEESKLIRMNDGNEKERPLSFLEIADWIEENL